MQVKGLMPPEDGISRKTPTGKAVGRNVVLFRNLLCFERILSRLPCNRKIGDAP